MAKSPYHTAFLALLERLNADQRQAVEHIEGPMMVIAGPGTGKTHLMAARVGKILVETDTAPQSILCLTFTDAAVSALRERLLHVIGPDAYRVSIATFHSFCHRVIQDNPDYFDFAELEPATELERIEIVRQLLADLPPEHPLRRGYKNPFASEKRLRNLFARMKSENWTPGRIHYFADKFIKNIPNDPEYIYQRSTAFAQKGTPKTPQIEAALANMERLKAAADLYPQYQNALYRTRRYEFEDMILWVLRAFKKHEALLRTYQERYLYILVDEFQDTNGAQYDLLNELLAYWSIPNVLIVGDDDQSIYEFQGARLEHLTDFQKRYGERLSVVVLRQNYRSAQNILDAAARLINYNTLRAAQLNGQPFDKHLIAQADILGLVTVHRYETRMAELSDVVTLIEKHLCEGIPPNEIAVIYAQHHQADDLQALLARRNIAHQARRPLDVLQLPLIEQVCDLLRYLAEEAQHPYSGEHRLFRLLHAPFWQFHPADLAKVALALRCSSEKEQRETSFWRNWIASPEKLKTLALQKPEAFEPLNKYLESWIAAVHYEPLPQFIERLYVQTGLLQWAAHQPNKWTLLQALKTFLDFAAAETMRRRESMPQADDYALARLQHFLRLIESMVENRLRLPLQQPLQAEAAVQLLTAHAAKGREFECVFLIDCTEDFWEKSNGTNRHQFTLPPGLQSPVETDSLEARRRLFYVAMTRAKRCLYISFAQMAADGKPLVASRFVAETGLPVVSRGVTAEHQFESLFSILHGGKTVEPPLLDIHTWRTLLADFQLSITALNRYLRCPLAFYYEEVLKIPSATSEAAAFGLSMHRAIHRVLVQQRNQQTILLAPLLQAFQEEMEHRRSCFSLAHFQQRLAFGRQMLQKLWEEHIPHWPQRAIAERRIDRVLVKGVPLTGIIDRIEWLSNGTLRIVDFKTGTPDLAKIAPPSEKHPYGGEYWRQLAFYRILVEKAGLFLEPVGQTVVQWLEPDRNNTLLRANVELSAQELSFMEELIAQTWHNIQTAQFNAGCQKNDCPWCRLHENRTLEEINRAADTYLDDSS
ncbi:MAG: ATP-dependent helicase [Saprospiraceae bacterium]|nr:ATP-dependent helicase [Saprospiraceae bacterium]MDW8482888.1 ATP-dependent DNA helicase [Saprospiraceae bacterium]